MAAAAQCRKYIYIVPGMKGSILKCVQCDIVVWPPEISEYSLFKHFIQGKLNGLEEFVDEKGCECLKNHRLVAEGIIKTVVAGRVFRKNVYGEFVKNIQENEPNAEIIEFAYDWRQSCADTAAKLAVNITQRALSSPTVEIILVAHSMGGLICRYLLESGKFHRDALLENIVTFVGIGCPHKGVMKALHRLLMAVNQPDDVTSSCLSMQSVYDLVPYDDLCGRVKFLECRQNASDDNIFLKGTIAHLLVDSSYTCSNDNHARYTEDRSVLAKLVRAGLSRERLETGLKFRRHLDFGKVPNHCKYMLINGIGIPTIGGIDSSMKTYNSCMNGDGVECHMYPKASKSFLNLKRNNRSSINAIDDGASIKSIHMKILDHVNIGYIIGAANFRMIDNNTDVIQQNYVVEKKLTDDDRNNVTITVQRTSKYLKLNLIFQTVDKGILRLNFESVPTSKSSVTQRSIYVQYKSNSQVKLTLNDCILKEVLAVDNGNTEFR